MEVLTKDEAAAWCRSYGLLFEDSPRLRDVESINDVCFYTESKQNVVEAFIRSVISNLDFDETVVWFTDWPLYKADKMAVIERFRASVGEKRSLIDAPGHLFGSDEVDDCIGLFNLSVQYFWDAFLFVPKEQLLVYNSHDEFLSLGFLNESGRDKVDSLVAPFALTRKS